MRPQAWLNLSPGHIGMNDIIRRKVAHGAVAGAEGGPGADQGWRLAFARAARDLCGLMVEVEALKLHRRSLAEILELPPDRAFLALLDGPMGGLGLLIMSPQVMAALIEAQTTGRVSSAPPLPRRPTRTDAAMVAGTIDRAMAELEQLLTEEADLIWAGGFRYASFLEDPRPLGLLLEDQPYRVLTADLVMGEGVRRGGLILALPAEGRGVSPAMRHPDPLQEEAPALPTFSVALAEAVMGAGCVLQAVIGRVRLPLQQVMALAPDQILGLPEAALDRITLEAQDGRRLARARLGQNKGLRALRLSQDGAAGLAGDSGPAGPGMSMPITLSAEAGAGQPGQELSPLISPDAAGGDGFPGFAVPLDPGEDLLAAG